jgi:hypothetical protein
MSLLLAAPAMAQMEFGLPPGQVSFLPLRIGEERGRLIQFLKARSKGPAPLVIMLDDWSKPGRRSSEWVIGLSDLLRARGMAFALVPADRFGLDNGAEVAMAVGVLRNRAADLEIDMNRIALLGEGLGAAYAAVLAMDLERAKQVGLDFDAIRVAVLLDGRCYDFNKCLDLASPRTRPNLTDDLPSDQAQREAASPMAHVAQPNVRSIYMHFDARSKDRVEGTLMLEAMRNAGQEVTVSTALLRFDQHSAIDNLQRERPNPKSETMLDYLAAQLGVQ